jgi:hypothetical protein
MPPNNTVSSATTKSKKKKGRPPAHQNAVAFHHNPKSKKTAHILSLPIQHVCGKCKEKLEWRKQYRKYKPLTQATKCNACEKRNVVAAYHTICSDCSVHSLKAKALLKEWNQGRLDKQQNRYNHRQQPVNPADHSDDTLESAAVRSDDTAEPADDDGMDSPLVVDDVTPASAAAAATVLDENPYSRVCAICVKEPALRGEQNDPSSSGAADTTVDLGALKLRELKTLRRQQERAQQELKQKNKPPTDVDADDNDNKNDETIEGGDGDDESDDEDDPFLLAIGGVRNLAVGEAYQQRILQQQES